MEHLTAAPWLEIQVLEDVGHSDNADSLPTQFALSMYILSWCSSLSPIYPANETPSAFMYSTKGKFMTYKHYSYRLVHKSVNELWPIHYKGRGGT